MTCRKIHTRSSREQQIDYMLRLRVGRRDEIELLNDRQLAGMMKLLQVQERGRYAR